MTINLENVRIQFMPFARSIAAFLAISFSGSVNASEVLQSPTAAPGQELVSPITSGFLFGEICIKTAPSFDNAGHAVAGKPFVQNTDTETYYHKTADLSVKVSSYGCTLVFLSRSSDDETISGIVRGLAISSKSSGIEIPGNIELSVPLPPTEAGAYFRIGLPRP